MCNPVKQDYFAETRFDDLLIVGSERLLRYCRTPIQIVPCPKNGKRLSSQAFVPAKGEKHTSIDLECLMLKTGLSEDGRFGVMPNTFALIAITTDTARAEASGVAWTPKPQTEGIGATGSANPFHGEVLGTADKKATRALAQAAIMIRSELDR